MIVRGGAEHLERIKSLYKTMKFEDQHLKENLTKNTLEIANKFVLLLKVHGDKLVKFFRKSFTESIVPCKPFWNIFATVRILLCEYYIQVLNGFWFALGWCLFCFIPTIIVAFKLTKHFLRMTELGKPDEYKKEKPEYELELIDEDSSSRSWVAQRNKIRPDNGWHRPVQHM
ncbi:prominin-1-like [Centruroides vittatus]|uniref:prominin-1-like n=1 Tax=Centruroides vittatus TaxID=120091 RepID=UPI00350FB9AC